MSFNDEMYENFGSEMRCGSDYDYSDFDGTDLEPDDYANFDDEPSDGFRDDVDADADALRGIGWGTDEDYGYDGMDYDFGMDG